MDFPTSLAHEVYTSFIYSVIFYVVLELTHLIGWVEYVIWPTLVILIFIMIIDDIDAYPDSISTPNQVLRLVINLLLSLLATFTITLVCDIPDVIEDDGAEKTLFEISTICRNGWVGMIIVRYCLCLACLSSTRTTMASWILLFNLFYLIWSLFTS